MASSSNTKTTMSYTSAIMTAGRATKIVTTSTTQTFAAKLSEITANTHTSTTVMQSTHTTVNKQKSLQANTVTVMSATAAATAQTSSQQPIVSTSPKHCRPLPTLSAPPTMVSHYSGKSTYSPGSNAAISPATSATVAYCPENSIASTCSNSVRVSPSPPIVSQCQQLQQQHQQQQQVRSSTPIASTIQEQQHQQQQQQQQTNNTPLEYSLFNDTFTKVTQQSMWGGRENESQKGMNFATVAGGGVSVNTSGSSSSKFIDPPQASIEFIIHSNILHIHLPICLIRMLNIVFKIIRISYLYLRTGGRIEGSRISRNNNVLSRFEQIEQYYQHKCSEHRKRHAIEHGS